MIIWGLDISYSASREEEGCMGETQNPRELNSYFPVLHKLAPSLPPKAHRLSVGKKGMGTHCPSMLA